MTFEEAREIQRTVADILNRPVKVALVEVRGADGPRYRVEAQTLGFAGSELAAMQVIAGVHGLTLQLSAESVDGKPITRLIATFRDSA